MSSSPAPSLRWVVAPGWFLVIRSVGERCVTRCKCTWNASTATPLFHLRTPKCEYVLVQSKSRRQSLVIPRFRIGHGAKDRRREEGRETEMVSFGILFSILAHTFKIKIHWHLCSGVWQNSPGYPAITLWTCMFCDKYQCNGASRGWVNLPPILFKYSIHWWFG